MSRLRLMTIVGARPQFVKASVLTRCINKRNKEFEEFIIHTGQHYDNDMSQIFFDDLNINKPFLNLNIGSGKHGEQTAKMIAGIEEQILTLKPDWIVLYGDTNSTLAGAIAASKISTVKIAHIEAGLRSYNRLMPEEVNRILTDHISHKAFAPTENALSILQKEGLSDISILSGDIMLDSTLFNLKQAKIKNISIDHLSSSKDFYLATIHRQENTDIATNLESIFRAFSKIDKEIILPLHPRTKQKLNNIKISKNIKIIDPVGPMQMLLLIEQSQLVLTDSGGLQKEAFFLKTQCVTLRNETEWIETLEGNWNQLVGNDENEILSAIEIKPSTEQINHFGSGDSANVILDELAGK